MAINIFDSKLIIEILSSPIHSQLQLQLQLHLLIFPR